MTNVQAVNWNTPENIWNVLWHQNITQMWTDTEFKVSRDLKSWENLSTDEQLTYKRILAGLTSLDTLQGDVAMPLLLLDSTDLKKKAVYSFMAMMEHMHAKSYSTIFTTLISTKETDYLLDEWVKSSKHFVEKYSITEMKYQQVKTGLIRDRYMARVASVFLETFQFYSGFYYPLLLRGQGSMIASGEIIRRILIDESIHGVAVGLDAQDIYAELSAEDKSACKEEVYRLLEQIMSAEEQYTHLLYDNIGLTDDVLRFIRYNANKALMNLGFDPYYTDTSFNPIVENALDTKTGNHDFFSAKGDGYELPKVIEPLEDEDFDVKSKMNDDGI